MKKDIILSLSGGLDSSSLAYEFKDEIKLAVSFKYGSNHEELELEAAKRIASKLGIEHRIIDLTETFKNFKSALLSGKDAVPDMEYNADAIKTLVVPFRNGIFLSILAGIADSNDCGRIALANHSNDSTTYPDCRPEFIDSMFNTISFGTEGRVKLFAPYTNITKNEIALRGLKAGLNFDDTYSCYKGVEGGCGECPTCLERLEAIKYANENI